MDTRGRTHGAQNQKAGGTVPPGQGEAQSKKMTHLREPVDEYIDVYSVRLHYLDTVNVYVPVYWLSKVRHLC